jgi:DNA primase large subunit
LGKEAKDFIKVPFKEAVSLVARRAVYLHKGIAYVPLKELYSIAAAHFRTRLS